MTIIRTCNHCGRCCHETPCSIGLAHVRGAVENNPCPALQRNEEQYFCGIMASPEEVLNLNWCDRLLPADAIQVKTLAIANIQATMRTAFQNECDSIFGQESVDQRIPVHQL